MREAETQRVRPELKVLVAEAARSLANLEVEGWRNLRCHARPSTEMLTSGATNFQRSARHARQKRIWPCLPSCSKRRARMLRSWVRLRELHSSRIEYCRRAGFDEQFDGGLLMGSINSAFSMITAALDADQAALNIISNNVANANTTGYTRQVPNWQENDPVNIGSSHGWHRRIGHGGDSVRDRVLEERLNQQEQLASASGSRLAALNTDGDALYAQLRCG